MISPELQRLLRVEILRHLNVILSGQSGANDDTQNETVSNVYPGMPQIQKRPVMHPYGFVSRATSNTISVTARQGADPQNRFTIGHRDALRPTDLKQGESAIYSSDGKNVLSWVKVRQDDIGFSTGKGLGVNGKMTKDGKLEINNATGELVTIVSEILAVLQKLLVDVQTGTVQTILGPNPLVMPEFAEHVVELTTQQTKFDTFKR